MKKEKKCILCGTRSKGSVGAAGIHWPILCQPCKDKEDKALADQLRGMATIFEAISG
jgi:hypothetical protein